MTVSRRKFLTTAGAVAAPMIVPSSVLGQRAGAVAPSDNIPANVRMPAMHLQLAAATSLNRPR